jgi:hemerythrin-like domain-containing protein
VRAICILGRERRVIGYLPAAIEIQPARLQSQPPVCTEFFRDALLFLRSFIDERRIRKEEDELFPSAEERIPAGGQTELDSDFARCENESEEAGVHDQYYGLAEKPANETAG